MNLYLLQTLKVVGFAWKESRHTGQELRNMMLPCHARRDGLRNSYGEHRSSASSPVGKHVGTQNDCNDFRAACIQ